MNFYRRKPNENLHISRDGPRAPDSGRCAGSRSSRPSRHAAACDVVRSVTVEFNGEVITMKVGICTKERKVRVASLELTFMGRQRTFEADAEVTFYPDDTASVECSTCAT